MVTCDLFGGMGNQICQIAATIALAKKNNVDFCIPHVSIDPGKWDTYFNHLPVLNFHARSIFREANNQAYQEIPYTPFLRLHGHFQSYKYYHGYEFEIADILGFKWTSERNLCSVHVRRGDYLNFPEIHPVVTKEYLMAAMDHIVENTDCRFAVFSDDFNWCRNTLGVSYKGRDIMYIKGGSDKHDLELMSDCRHNIIANSSYSLVAALFNRHTDKIVIAPKIWTMASPSYWDTSNFIPPNWIKL